MIEDLSIQHLPEEEKPKLLESLLSVKEVSNVFNADIFIDALKKKGQPQLEKMKETILMSDEFFKLDTKKYLNKNLQRILKLR